MALTDHIGRDRLVSLAALPRKLGAPVGRLSDAGPVPRMALDQIYEYSLLVAVQVIVERRAH